jgi:hypothetical protein
MGHRCPPLSLHARQFRRQNHRRSCRRAYHDRAQFVAGGVRPARLLLLLPLLHLCDRLRLHHQPGSDSLGDPRPRLGLGADAIPDARQRRFRHLDDLPRHPRCRRGAGLLRCGPFRLQVVPRPSAHAADGDPGARLVLRRDHRRATLELDHCQPFLALGVRRPRHCRPDLVRAMACVRPRRPARSKGRARPRRGACPL